MEHIKPNQIGMWDCTEINPELSITWKKISSDISRDICNISLVNVFNLYIPVFIWQSWSPTEP